MGKGGRSDRNIRTARKQSTQRVWYPGVCGHLTHHRAGVDKTSTINPIPCTCTYARAMTTVQLNILADPWCGNFQLVPLTLSESHPEGSSFMRIHFKKVLYQWNADKKSDHDIRWTQALILPLFPSGIIDERLCRKSAPSVRRNDWGSAAWARRHHRGTRGVGELHRAEIERINHHTDDIHL